MVAAPLLMSVAKSLMPVAKSRRACSASLALSSKRRAERGAPQASGRIGARRFLVLGNPGQRGFHIGEFTGGKSFDPDTRGFRLFLGEFRGCDGMHPHQTAAHFGREFLLLLFGHYPLLQIICAVYGAAMARSIRPL